jgi:hypothetical protein
MIQLHDLNSFVSLVDFRFSENDVNDLIAHVKKLIKGKNRYHYIILDTKNDIIIKNYERGF